jgi:hypothetical protein
MITAAQTTIGPLTEDEAALVPLTFPAQDCGYHHDPKARCWACTHKDWDDAEARRVLHNREHRRSMRRMYA